jgi:hypothetical protein
VCLENELIGTGRRRRNRDSTSPGTRTVPRASPGNWSPARPAAAVAATPTLARPTPERRPTPPVQPRGHRSAYPCPSKWSPPVPVVGAVSTMPHDRGTPRSDARTRRDPRASAGYSGMVAPDTFGSRHGVCPESGDVVRVGEPLPVLAGCEPRVQRPVDVPPATPGWCSPAGKDACRHCRCRLSAEDGRIGRVLFMHVVRSGVHDREADRGQQVATAAVERGLGGDRLIHVRLGRRRLGLQLAL